MPVSPLERVITALDLHGCKGRGSNYQCPAHDDRNESLSVQSDARGVLLNCFAGCDWKDIVNALGLSPDDIFEEPREVARYKYTSPDGEILFAKVRFEPKRFTVVHPVGDGWEHGLNGAERPLYRLPEVMIAVRAGQVIFLPEGEKDADRLWSLGYAATTNFDGAGKWRPEYGDALRGADVVIIADRDEPGVQHALQAYADLKQKAASVRIVQSRTEGDKHDVSDHLDAGYRIDELVPLRSENEISRRYRRVDWADAFTRAVEDVDWLLPPVLEAGTINALFGKPGVGKSLVTLEWAVTLVREGRQVMIIDDENRVQDTVDRLRAFGCSPSELDSLIVYNFAGLPPLDTPEGGQHLLALAEVNEPSLVVLDTTTRMVEGDENASNTWLQLYRCSLVPLKNKGIAVLRLDHPGKDDTRGQRGSSAKAGDVDSIWRLSDISNSDTLTLIREKSRSGHGESVITYRRHQQLDSFGRTVPGSLRHEVIGLGDLDILPKVRAISSWFDRHDVPRDTGRPRLRDVLVNTHGSPECSTTLLALVARYRKSLIEEGE